MNRANRAVSRARLLEDESAAAEVDRLASRIRDDVRGRLHRRGVVVGCSGGVDSSVVLALCVRALGPDGVLALLMPERESSPESVVLASEWAIELGTAVVTEDVTAALEGAGCYRRRDEAIARLFPEFDSRWKSKISLPGGLLEEGTLNVFNLTVIDPAGGEHSVRIPPGEFAQIVAASNFKQRTRMAMLYYHAEMRNYAVAGTGNRDEHELGFFVKYGDGGADLAPILHLYKVEIYRLAEALDVPEPIRRRTPTSDTYSAGSSQEEFFFRLPFDVLDPIWALNEGGVSAETIAVETGFTVEQVGRVVQDIARKRRSTEYLRTPPITYPRQATE